MDSFDNYNFTSTTIQLQVMNCGKKLVIKNFTGIPTISESYKEKQLAQLESAVSSIYHDLPTNVAYEELYKSVENLCTFNHKETLYESLYTNVENYLKSRIDSFNLEEKNFLEILNNFWTAYCKQSKLINNIYLYLDRSIINDKHLRNSIWTMNLMLYKSNIILNSFVKNKVLNEIFELIDKERNGQKIDRVILKSIMEMLNELQIYEEIFSGKFLQISDTLYKEESEKLMDDFDVITYLNYVQRRMNEEQDRIKCYLHKSSEKPLADILKKRLLKDHLQTILTKGVDELVDNNKIEELSLLFVLLDQVNNGHLELSKVFNAYLIKTGKTIVQDPEKDKSMVEDLLNFKDKIDNIVTESFKTNIKFVDGVRNSFKFFINQRHNKPAELLAKFVDSQLRSKSTEEDIERILNKVMVIFRFIQGKDIFEAFYKKDLAKRLLVGKSASQDAENSMISKLKLECGSGFTAKLEGMFKDIRLSQDINTSFKQHFNNLQGSSEFTAEMNINVLTTGYWPSFPVFNVNLPEEMVNYQSIFQKFYITTYSGRKLQWQPNLGFCILKAYFPNGMKELQVSLFQTIILLLFNVTDEISYKDIKEATNLDATELKRTLQSLACGKSRVILKNPKGKDIGEEDMFVFNKDFSDKLFRVKINQVQLKETVEEQQATEEAVLHDRQYQIDAAIVRIMKQKKVLSHNLLINELYNVLDIPVKALDFKKRIELLIDREYIERDKENSNFYRYVA